MKKENVKKVRTARRRTLRTCLLIATLVAIIFGTISVARLAGTLTWTQIRMGYYYSEIQDLESERASLQAEALNLVGEVGRAYQAQADACVERSDALSTLRKELHNSSDPVVAFAAKDYFEFKILLLGVGILLGWALLLRTIFRHMAEIVIAEEKIVSSALSVFFAISAFVCYLLSRLFRTCSIIFVPARKKKSKKARVAKRSIQSNVVPFKKRRIG